MATNNLLVNNEYKVLRESRNKVERSPHNLSQSRKFPVEIGKIYPIFCRKTLPSDSFKIDANILVKQLQPLLVPQMVSFSVQTAFYWVDYSLAWPQFEYFLINQRGDQSLELPFFIDINKNGTSITASTFGDVKQSQSNDNFNSYYGLLDNVRPFLDFTANPCNDKVDALPFWAYQRIIRDYYTNIDRLSEQEYSTLFPKDPNKTVLKEGLNFCSSSADGYTLNRTEININKIIPLSKIGVHNVRGDYFVNSYPTPIRGDTPILTNTLNLDSFKADVTGNINFNVVPVLEDLNAIILGHGQGVSYDEISNGHNLNISSTSVDVTDEYAVFDGLRLDYDHGNTPKPLYAYPTSNPLSVWQQITNNENALKAALTSNSITSQRLTFSNIDTLSYDLSITTRELRLLDAITRKREIDILMKPRLKNYLQTYFGVDNYKHDSLYQPVFIGSTTQQILINDIEQTTTTETSPLGRQGATAISLADNYVGEYYCRNYGCLMGVMFILPDYDYEPALPHEWSERTPDDFYNPEFAHLSMQAILNKELFVSQDDDWNNQVLGYGGVYDYYRTSNNYVSSLFLSADGVNEDIKQFAQVRRFKDNNKPEITTQFLDSHSAFDMSVFAVPTMPPFICQAVTRVRAVRPLPELATPDSTR